jgi:putative hydrolase of the HAD superfamily
MIRRELINTLFLDIGGVLLTNGWDHKARILAAKEFSLDLDEMNERHHLTFDTYESGKLSLEEYLNRVVFYENRSFTTERFKEFIFEQSKPFPEMIKLIQELKLKYGLKIAVVSNEGRELNTYRINKFRLHDFVDFFISSCYIHYRKPDVDIFKIAVDIAHVTADQVVYIDDRSLFVQVAEGLGISGIHHTNYETTCNKFNDFGLKL